MIIAFLLCLINCYLQVYIKEDGFHIPLDFWKMFLFVVIFMKVIVFLCVRTDNVPSLLTANATIAIVIDREYLAEKFEPLKVSIEDYLVYAKREIIKHGGVNVQYFSWTGINVKRDFTAILSVASCVDTWNLYKIAAEENILHMAISETDCPRMPPEEAFTVPLVTLGAEMPQLLLDLRTSGVFKWPSAVILYDHTLERDLVTNVVTALTKESESLRDNAAISVIKLDANSSASENRLSIKQSLQRISTKTVGNNFMVIVAKETMEIIMDVAKSLGIVRTTNQWLYIISDTDSKKDNISGALSLLKEGDNVAFIFNTTTSDPSCTGGLECHTEEILEAFSRSLEIAILGEYELASQVSDEEWEAIRPTKIERRNSLLANIRSHLLQYGSCDNCTNWKFQAGDTWGKEFQSSSTKSTELIDVGSWRPSDGTKMTDVLFPHVVHGFRGKVLPVLTFHNPPWQILTMNETGLITREGIVFDVLDVLAKNLNFTYSVDVIRIEPKYNISENSTKYDVLEMMDIVTNVIPEKVIEMIRTKQMALAAAAFTVTEQSKAVINFTRPISTQSYTFLVARPRELSRALLFMSPFTYDTWLCLGAAIVSMGPILYYIHILSPVYEYRGISMIGGLSSIQNCIWYMYGALLQQGGMHLPQADSARLIVGSWWLVVLVVATTYCGNLVAFLTFPKIDNPIATIDDLLEHSETVSWSLSKGSYLESQLKAATELKYKTLLRGGTSHDLYSKDMLPMIQEGKHVFIDWKLRLQYVMRKQYLITDKCDLALGSDEFFDEKLALILAQDTPYLDIFNEEIKRLHQNGLIDKWLKDYLPKKDKCFKVRNVAEVQNHTVNMDDMQGSFFVLFFGFILAVLLISGEKVWHNYALKRGHKIIQPYTS